MGAEDDYGDQESSWRDRAIALHRNRKSLSAEQRAAEQVPLANDMHRAGVLNADQHVFVVMMGVEHVVDERIMNGASSALNRISRTCREIEMAHGLGPDQYFAKADLPDDLRALDKEYCAVIDKLHAAALDEFGAPDLAMMLRANPGEIEEMRERGRRAFFHKGKLQ